MAAGTKPPPPPLIIGCKDSQHDQVANLDVNQQLYLSFANAANPGTPTPAPSPSPTPGLPMLPAGAKLVFNDKTLVQQASSEHPDPLAIGGSTLPVGYKIIDKKSGRTLAATKDTGPLSLAMFVPMPAAQTPKSPSSAAPPQTNGATPLSVNQPFNDKPNVVSVGSTPVPLPAASSGDRATVGFAVTALQPGRAHVLIDSGEGSCMYVINVTPGNAQKHLIFSAGVAGSNIPVQSNTAVVPSPQPSGTPPGQFVYHTEHSEGQTFVPILAHYRVSDFPSPLQLYLTGGIAATASTGKSLFGLSLGVNDQAFLTAGWHSTTVDQLQSGINPDAFTPFSAFPAGAPLTFSQRTTRPFISISFPLCSVTAIFSGLGTAQCATPTPAPTSTPAPQPPAKTGT